MSVPYARRKVTVNPVFDLPGGIEDVEYDEDHDFTSSTSKTNNSYTGPIRDDRPGGPNGNSGGSGNDPNSNGGPVSHWNVAKEVSQELVINAFGVIVAEVTFELPDWQDDYEVGISRL